MNAIAWLNLIGLILQATEAELPLVLGIIQAIRTASQPHQVAIAETLAASKAAPK